MSSHNSGKSRHEKQITTGHNWGWSMMVMIRDNRYENSAHLKHLSNRGEETSNCSTILTLLLIYTVLSLKCSIKSSKIIRVRDGIRDGKERKKVLSFYCSTGSWKNALIFIMSNWLMRLACWRGQAWVNHLPCSQRKSDRRVQAQNYKKRYTRYDWDLLLVITLLYYTITLYFSRCLLRNSLPQPPLELFFSTYWILDLRRPIWNLRWSVSFVFSVDIFTYASC